MNDLEKTNLPGGALPFHHLFQPRLEDGKEVGVVAPNGKYYQFNNNETFAQIEFPDIPGTRVSVIVEPDGKKRLFEEWALAQDQQE